jgi:ubiquinone/menaquinone biosynthesis C-methylase UbiE
MRLRGVTDIRAWWRWREKADHTPQPFPASLSWLLDNPLMRALAGPALRRLDLAPGMRVLDAGCGPGRLTVPLAEQVGPTGAVVAFDLQPAMLDRTARRARERGLSNVSPLEGGIGEGVLTERDAFDRAVLVTVLGEVPAERREEGLREIHAALKPGGIVLVSEGFADPDYLSPETVRRLGDAAGFELAGERLRLFGFELRLRKPA